MLLKTESAKILQSGDEVALGWLETFDNFKDLLEKEYINTISCGTYAADLFVSCKLLNDIVKRLTGKTVKALINDFVTMGIKRRLASTSLSVQETGHKTGFEDPVNMIKFFKRNTGNTPHKYRRQA